MADAFTGEIRLFGGAFAPIGWHICDGTVLPVQGNEALFSLIGATYGGNGSTQFALPDLRGRVPIGQGQGANLSNRVLGQQIGTEAVSLTPATMAAHTHPWQATNATATLKTPSGNLVGATPSEQFFDNPTSQTNITPLDPRACSASQGTSPAQALAHNNMMPSLPMQYIICVTAGLYPSRA